MEAPSSIWRFSGTSRVADSHRNPAAAAAAGHQLRVGGASGGGAADVTALLMSRLNLTFQQALPVADHGSQLELTSEQRPHLPRSTPERTAIDQGIAEVPAGGFPASACQRWPCNQFLHPDPGLRSGPTGGHCCRVRLELCGVIPLCLEQPLSRPGCPSAWEACCTADLDAGARCITAGRPTPLPWQGISAWRAHRSAAADRLGRSKCRVCGVGISLYPFW